MSNLTKEPQAAISNHRIRLPGRHWAKDQVVEEVDLSEMNEARLQELCQRAGLSHDGTADVLTQRLIDLSSRENEWDSLLAINSQHTHKDLRADPSEQEPKLEGREVQCHQISPKTNNEACSIPSTQRQEGTKTQQGQSLDDWAKWVMEHRPYRPYEERLAIAQTEAAKRLLRRLEQSLVSLAISCPNSTTMLPLDSIRNIATFLNSLHADISIPSQPGSVSNSPTTSAHITSPSQLTPRTTTPAANIGQQPPVGVSSSGDGAGEQPNPNSLLV